MFVEISTQPKMMIDLDEEETDALVLAYEIIDKIEKITELEKVDTVVIDNEYTGECIDSKEFCRVKGIISGIVNHNGAYWDLI